MLPPEVVPQTCRRGGEDFPSTLTTIRNQANVENPSMDPKSPSVTGRVCVCPGAMEE